MQNNIKQVLRLKVIYGINNYNNLNKYDITTLKHRGYIFYYAN